jgi:hypothetical protein
VPLFFAGRAREVLRKLRKEVLPEAREPMMRILWRVSCDACWSQQGTILKWCRVLPPTDSARAVDGAHSAAGIAVAATVGHALRPRVRVHRILEAVLGDGGDGDAARS